MKRKRIITILALIITLSLSYLAFTEVFFSEYSFTIKQIKNSINKDKLLNSYNNLLLSEKRKVLDSVSKEHIQSTISYLSSDIGIRFAGTEAEAEAGFYLQEKLEEYGYTTNVQLFNIPQSKESLNVLAYKNSEFAEEKETLILGAHIDSTILSPGAMDNASGAASLLEIARVTYNSNTKYHLVFIFFGSEECLTYSCQNYHEGSLFYVSQLTDEEKSKLAGMINLDVVGATPVIQLRREAGLGDELADSIYTSFEEIDITTTIMQSENWSDHESFERANIPAVFIYTPFCCFGHSPEDTIDKVNMDRVVEITKGVIWFLIN